MSGCVVCCSLCVVCAWYVYLCTCILNLLSGGNDAVKEGELLAIRERMEHILLDSLPWGDRVWWGLNPSWGIDHDDDKDSASTVT